jgi:hypothetical protein
LLAQKKEARKRHPDCAGPLGSLALLAVVGTLKNSASPQTGLTSFPNNSYDAQGHRMGYLNKSGYIKSHLTQPSSGKITGSA